MVPSESSVPLASSGSVPLLPLPARALRAYQRHVGAVWAAWPALDGPGQPAREGCARRPRPDPNVHVSSEVRAFRHRAPAEGRRREEGRGWGAGRVIVCIAALGRVTLCDRRRLLCLVRQDLCVGRDGRGVQRGLLLDHLLSLLNLFALSEGDDLSIQVSEAAPILELRAKASPAITMTRSGHAAASIAGGHFTGRVNRLRKGRDLQSAPRHHTMHSPHQRAATAPIALPCPTPRTLRQMGDPVVRSYLWAWR